MNERIYELKLEAAQWAKQNHQAVDPENLTKQEYERRVLMMTDKFAELIVLESSKWIVDNAGSINELGPEYFATALCRHFGVE